MATESEDSENSQKRKDRFDHYWSYAQLWRTWVIGIAAGALFILLNKDVGGKFSSKAWTATLFILAAGCQVVLAWINKTSAFYEYRLECGDTGKDGNPHPWVRMWCWIGRCYLIDFFIDLISVGFVAWAVYEMITGLLSSPSPEDLNGPVARGVKHLVIYCLI